MFEDKSSQLCRLCLKSGACPIDIYDPKRTNGFLLWEIIEELTEIKVPMTEDESGPFREDLCGQGDVHTGGTWNNLEAEGIESEMHVEHEEVAKEMHPLVEYTSTIDGEIYVEEMQSSDVHGSASEVTINEQELLAQGDLCLHLSSRSSDEGSDVEECALNVTGPEAEVTSVNCTDEPNVPVDGDRERVGNLEETLISEKGPNRFAGTGHQRLVGIQCGAFVPVATHSPFKQRRLRSNSWNEDDGVAVDVRVESEGRKQIKKRNPATCHICKKNFSQRGHLNVHIKTVHLKERKFSCVICGKAFGEKGNLQSHMRSHSGLKAYTCSHCEKGFTESGPLRRHIRAVHEMEKPHTCGECGKAFSDISNFKTHMLVHTGERPHTCDICSRSFSQKSHLPAHMLIHTGEKPHTCNVCSKTFRQNGSLKRHMAIHGRNVPHP